MDKKNGEMGISQQIAKGPAERGHVKRHAFSGPFWEPLYKSVSVNPFLGFTKKFLFAKLGFKQKKE